MKQKLRLGDNYALLATNDTKHKRKRAVHAPLDIRSSSVRFSLLLRCFSAALLLEKWRRNGKQTDNKGKTGSTDNPQVYSRCCASNGLQRKISGAEADNLDGQSLWGKQRLPLSQIPPSLIPHPCPIPVISVYPSVKVPKIGILTKVWRLYGGIKAYTEGYGRCIGSCIKKSLLCVQTHAQAPAHPGRGRANGVLALLLLAVSIGLQASPLARQSVPGDSLPGRQAGIKPLQIGDTIPDLPVTLFSSPDAERETTISRLANGKWIILEFWNTFCGPCIASLPHLFDLQAKFNDSLTVIPVTHESGDHIRQFLSKTRSPHIDKIRDKFISAVDDKTLAGLFPTQSLPHTVIVDDRGIVQVITRPQALDEKRVSTLLTAGVEEAGINTIADATDLSVLDINDNRHAGLQLYSALSGHHVGAVHQIIWETDSTNHRSRLIVSNAVIPKLYTIALNSPLPINKNRIILEISHARIRNLLMPSANTMSTDRPDLFCYEIFFPSVLGRRQVLEKMKSDLDFFLQLHGRIESRSMRCLALRAIDSPPTYKSESGSRVKVVNGRINSRFVDQIKDVGALPNGVDTYIRHGKFADVMMMIDEITNEPLPSILNETGYEGRFDLDFPSAKSATLETINRSLNAQGLELSWVEREMDMFVLTENGFDGDSGRLQLTDFGYIFSSTAKQ
ncbi:TlpA family protein disulfide reductase [Parapedobacter sp. ISTM3]|uniref:TlpA family protein disulfide reductase n=1 Tax=Parapedobacter sp. ISTM3 TaxID=2800130 RepID=UPI0019078444|nr:TlpA disulfide reductase family protein [Parapedobacter sp. ISTM3]MBK1440744.1 TlpA family protein disulfide reductase [Parapedobacter sp. ISTM3]